MSRILYNSTIQEFVGKLAGSVFQDSYFGAQIRTRVSPRNPSTPQQQLRRGEFSFITRQWRNMSSAQRASFVSNYKPLLTPQLLYIESSINRSLVNLPLVSSFTNASPSDVVVPLVLSLAPPVMTVHTTTPNVILPYGYLGLVYATAEHAPAHLFTNPANYQPILIVPSGTNISNPINLAPAWVAHYGQFTSNKRICIKGILINTTSGLRGSAAFACATEPPPETFYILNAAGNFLIDSDGTFIISQ